MSDTSATPSREEEMMRFKARFVEDLNTFIEKQQELLQTEGVKWHASDWNVSNLRFSKKNAAVTFKYNANVTTNQPTIGFAVHDLPRDLIADEQFALRQWMVEECESKEFIGSKVRQTYLSTDVIDGVRKRDPEALKIWIDKHTPYWTKIAKRYLGRGINASPEDIVQEALIKFIMRPTHDQNPANEMGRGILESALTHRRKKANRTTSHPIFNDLTEKSAWQGRISHTQEFSESHHVNSTKLRELLEETKNHLTERQKQILDVFIMQHNANLKENGEYHVLSYQEIANKILPNEKGEPLSIERIAQLIKRPNDEHCKGLIDVIQKIAKKMGRDDPEIEDIANYIITMLRCDKAFTTRSL